MYTHSCTLKRRQETAVLYAEISKGSTAQLCQLGLYKFLIDLVNVECEQYKHGSKSIKIVHEC